ncbi:MAG: hypothetical protein M3336_11790, partial [Chloroflexota bacterium]|nr:hypothetical protein [Chloroflexota bacterium]
MIGGPEPLARWGYVAATLAFVLSAGQMAPLVALISRATHAEWGVPLHRMADIYGLSGVVAVPLLLVLLLNLPDWRGRAGIWLDWPLAPRVWDAVAGLGLALLRAALAWLSTWPMRGSRGWFGSTRQWRVLSG